MTSHLPCRRRPLGAAGPTSGGGALRSSARAFPLAAALCVALCVAFWAATWPAAMAARAGVATPDVQAWRWPIDDAPSVAHGFQPPPEPWLAGHRGVDLRGSPGDAIRAAGAGRVSFAGLVAGKPVVVVAHAGGLRTTYEPVITAVREGEVVAAGAVLGRLSAAGSHCFPLACLHWGLRRGDTYLDPLALVGAQLRVRLLPVWDPGYRAAAHVPSNVPTSNVPTGSPEAALSADASRIGALNRARASPSQQ